MRPLASPQGGGAAQGGVGSFSRLPSSRRRHPPRRPLLFALHVRAGCVARSLRAEQETLEPDAFRARMLPSAKGHGHATMRTRRDVASAFWSGRQGSKELGETRGRGRAVRRCAGSADATGRRVAARRGKKLQSFGWQGRTGELQPFGRPGRRRRGLGRRGGRAVDGESWERVGRPGAAARDASGAAGRCGEKRACVVAARRVRQRQVGTARGLDSARSGRALATLRRSHTLGRRESADRAARSRGRAERSTSRGRPCGLFRARDGGRASEERRRGEAAEERRGKSGGQGSARERWRETIVRRTGARGAVAAARVSKREGRQAKKARVKAGANGGEAASAETRVETGASGGEAVSAETSTGAKKETRAEMGAGRCGGERGERCGDGRGARRVPRGGEVRSNPRRRSALAPDRVAGGTQRRKERAG